MNRIIAMGISILSLVLALQSIYCSGFGLFNPMIHRPLALGGAMLIVLYKFTLLKKWDADKLLLKTAAILIDLAVTIVIIIAVWRYIAIGEQLEDGFFELSNFDKYVALAMILVILDLTRRAFGLPLFIITGFSLVYVFWGEFLPGIFQNAGYSMEIIVTDVWLSTSGIMGMPMAVMLNMVLIFITFGVLLEGTKVGDALMKISVAASSRFRGGPAHAAVIASALFGTMSGSPVANVVGTGTFTIPMTKKHGFPSVFAAGIEASASTAGQILPPVMGAAAFLLAEYAGVSYLKVAIAALVPGLLFYFSLFITVELEAARLGFKANPESGGLSSLSRKDWIKSLTFIIPIAVIIFVLVNGRSPANAGFWGTISLLIIGLFNLDWRIYHKIIFPALVKAGKACAEILTVVGCVGILIAILDTTGAGLKFAQFILSFTGESLFISLILTMIGCIILGMGMPTFPAYLVIVLVLGPVIVQMGVIALVMHLFIFYFGVFSHITPPVAMASYAAANVAGSGPIETCVAAFKIGLIGFIIPFVFVYHPSLLLVVENFDLFDMIISLLRLVFAFFMINTAVMGMSVFKLAPKERFLRLITGFGVLLEFPSLQIGFGLMSLILIIIDLRRRKEIISVASVI